MRRAAFLLLLFCSAKFVSPLNGQCSGKDGSLDESVRLRIECGISEGTRDKQIWMAGDEASVVLTRLIQDKTLSDKEIAPVLDVLDEVLHHPAWAEVYT